MSTAANNLVRAYKRMAHEANYRPGAPSDGLGTITESLEDLDLDMEALEYAREFSDEEDAGVYCIGCTDFPTAGATMYVIEAARVMCGGSIEGENGEVVEALLELALEELRDACIRPETFLKALHAV
jgi:hypothetical protein